MTSREVMLEGGSPWGFRMHGGVDQQQPLKVSRVNPGSKAAFKGIREGDIITSINAKSTKDITNSEAHALLRHAGNTLTLGLNEDLTNSPKRRQYRYAQQESQSDIVKRSSTSSITLNKFDTSEIYDTESISLNEDAPRSNGITSQRSTLSSNCSSAPSTPSDTRANNTDANCIQNVDLSILTACDAMADISNNISRSRRRRNRRKSKRNGNTVDGSSITSETLLISEEISIDSNETAIDTLKDIKINTVQSPNINEASVTNVINKQSEENEATISENVTVKTATDRLLQEEANYRVESPTPPAKKASPPKNGAKKSPVKSRSLDDDEIKITELSEVSETEEKAETTGAIVAEVESESDREEAKNLQTTNEHSNKTDRAETKTMSSDDEDNLKMTPTRVTDDKSIDEKKPNAETPKVKKAKTRAELVQYFMPIYQNPRYLDAISEESSDLSDKEQIETRKRTVTQTKAKHGKRFGPIRVAEQPQLVDARIIDNVNVAETICTVATTESRSAGAELVYIDDSGADTETDDYADIDDDEFNECLAANGIRPDRSHAGTYSDAEPTSKETDVDTRSIPLTQLTPPPTPDHETTSKHECTRLIGDMHEFIATVETYVLQQKQKQLQATLLDPRYLCLPKELKEKINCAVRCDDNNRDRVVEAAVYSNVVTPTPSRSPSAGSDSGSSRATSLCTTKYNPSSSVGDMKSIDVNADNPITLREICVNKLISLPFGADILEELAEVSRNLQQLTQITGNSNVQTQPSPAFIVKEPPSEINNNSLKFASDSQYSDSNHWLGPHEERANPQLDRANKIKNLKEAFLNDTNCQDSSTFENATGKNRLLAIIKSSSLDDEYKTDSSEDHAPPVPPKPKFHRSLGALPTAQPTIEGNEARLKAQNLSEWLKLARNKSVSDSNFQTATSKSNSHRETNSMYCILEDEQKQSRRASLPPNLYQKQMDDILRKEMEVKEEIKRLETERLRLSSERMVKPSDDRCVESEITKRTSTTSCDVRQIPIRMESDGNAAIECGDAAKEITIPITLDEGFQIKTVENEISNRTTNVASRVKQIPITLLDDECNKTEAIADDGNKPKERVAPIAELQISPPIDHNVRIVPMKIESESSDKIIPIEIENDVSVAKLQVTQRDVDSYKTEKRESFEERFKRFFDHKMQEHHKPSPILLLDHNNNNNEELNVRIRNVKSEDDTNINNNSIGKNQTNERIIPIKIDNLESESQKQTGAVKTETIIPITLTNVNSDINRKENIIPIAVEANENALKPNDGKERGEEKTTRETIIPIQLEAKGDVKERTIPIEVEKDKRFEPNDYIISKQGDIAIFNEEFKTKRSFLSNLPPPTEIFRQQMFEEYKNRMAERMERKHQKIIKISSRPEDNNCTAATATNVANNATLLDIENEFIDKAKRRMDKYGIKLDGSPAKEGSSERSDADENGKADVVIVEGDGVLRDRKKLPQHLREFVDITRNADEDAVDGIWSPGQQSSSTFKSESLTRSKESNVLDDDPIPPVWTPKSAHSSPKADRKEFKPVNFKSPILGRRNRVASEGSAESVETSWKLPASHGEGATSNKGIPNSYSAPASGFVDINAISRLPKAQNPTITLLQRAREGQLPRGAYYLDKNEQMKSGDRSNDKQVYDIKLDYTSESEGERQSKRMSDSGKSDGPNKGVPFVLRSDVRDANQSRWYKKMYDTIHKQKDDEEFVTVRYKQRRGRYPYTSGYFSEPDPATYDSDASDLKFSTLDQRRLPSNGNVKGKENGFAYSSATMPRNSTTTVKYTIPPSDAAKHAQDVYRNQPGRIENYVPGHSSISEKEAKEWWDEVMDIFDGWLEDHSAIPSYNYLLSRAATRSHLEQQKHVPQPRSFINQALKESGYESDSTLVFRRRNDTAQQQLSPSEQKEAYKTIQKGGDVPLQGLRKPAPERPKDDADLDYVTSTLNPLDRKSEVFCYPLNVPVPPPHVFANYKRTAPSAAPRSPPPSPPKRKSSRNNSTLRLMSTLSITTKEKSKRHETCFKQSTPDVERQRVRYLRDKLTCKLLPKRRGDDRQRLKVTKTVSTSPTIKPSKLSSTLTASKDAVGKITAKSMSSVKTDKPSGRCCARSSSASPIRKMCKQCTLDVERQSKPSTSGSRGVSLDRTFGAERKRIDLSSPTSAKHVVKSPDLHSPKTVTHASSPTYKKTSSVLSSYKNGTKSIHKEPSIAIRVGYSDKGKEIVKANLRPKSLPTTPVFNRSARLPSPSPSNASKTRSNVSLNSISSRSSRDTCKTIPATSKVSAIAKPKSKNKKDLVNGEIAMKNKKIAAKPLSLAKKASSPSRISLSDIKRQKDAVQSNTFFQNLFLRDLPEVSLPSAAPSHQSSWIAEKTSLLTRNKSSTSEPSVRALKIYLNHTKPVTDSKFRTIDAIRSRSASPKAVSWRRRETVADRLKKDERSCSLPPKLVFTQTGRPVSPVIVRRKSKSDSAKKSDTPRQPSPAKLVFTETSRPVSPVIQRKPLGIGRLTRRSPILKYGTLEKRARSESPKFYSTETSRPISPVIERRSRRKDVEIKRPKSPKSPKFYSTETSRPVSPIVEKRPDSVPKRRESPKFYSTETSRPASPVIEKRYPQMERRRERSKSPILYFTETFRPVSPLTQRRLTKRDIINTELVRRRTPSPPKLIFTETSRPVSPLVERRRVISPYALRKHRDHSESPERRSSPSGKQQKLIFTETSRPVSPIVGHRSKAAIRGEESDHFVHAQDGDRKLHFTETSRPVSPVIERRPLKKSSSLVYEPSILQKSKMKSIRSRSAGDTADRRFVGPERSCFNLSTSSIDSIDRMEYQAYIKEMQQSTQKSVKFKELNNFFTTLERMSDLERTASSAELRPRRKHEDEIIDYERWKEVRTRERAEKELNDLYEVLKERQKEKGLLFLPKAVETSKWKMQLDRGLRLKEKSVENIKDNFERLNDRDDLDAARKQAFNYSKDTYKPLWRGNSVINLAHSMVERRSHSESGSRTTSKRADAHNNSHGIGSHIWSSLSMDQVNILKNQLNEIYSQGNGSNKRNEPEDRQVDNTINVPDATKAMTRCGLSVRRSSDSVQRRPPSQTMTTSLPETTARQLTETDKRKLSQSLSKEVLDRVTERKRNVSPSLVFGKETRGAIAAAEAKVKYPEVASPRTCYSLEPSEDGHERDSGVDNQFLLVLANKESDREQISHAISEFALPEEPLTKTDATANPIKSSNSETESSTDGSTRTVVRADKKAEVQKKVEYFESASERDVYTPTIHKPAENGAAKEERDDEETREFERNEERAKFEAKRLAHSQSFQNIKELFGEQELAKLANVPLSESRKVLKSHGPQLRATSLSPIRSTVSAASTDSLCRSRSLSPYYYCYYPDDCLAAARSGDVNRLRTRFEDLDARRWRSDPQLDRKRTIYVPGHAAYGEDVGSLRRRFEYSASASRGRSRVRRGVVSPAYLRAEDRLMPHINIISKIASLYPRRSVSPSDERRKSNEELAEIFGIAIGEVEKLRKRFDSPQRRVSLLGHMFTSSPDMQELRDISPYLTASWIAHRYPRKEDNAIAAPAQAPSTSSVAKVRKDKHVPKPASPVIPNTSKPSSILKIKEAKKMSEKCKIDERTEREYDPNKHRPVSRYQPEIPKQDQLRYRSWWPTLTTHNRPTVTFKEPDGPISPAIGHQLVRNPPIPESPRKYVENEVTIHYRTPIRQEIKEAIGEDELARRQAEAMKKIYQEERRRKYLQELQDVNSRRHTDNFIPSQKSPIPLNRYDDVVDSFSPKVKPRPRSPEPRLVARALYNFVGQSARELTFRKGDIIYIKRQVDKNWYEGEHNAMIGLFPANYVEIIPYDGVKTTPRKSHEGQARAKYNFIAQTHLELSLAKGELVVITRKVDDNWYEGKIGGRKGIFPASYVEVLIDPIDPPPSSTKPVASPASHSLLLNGSAGGKESMGTHSYTPSFPHQPLTSSYHRAKPVQVTGSGTYGTLTRKSPIDQTLHIDTQSEPVPYRALYKYRPQNDDELELLEGDTVFVLEKCDDGWFVGSSERTGAFGTFPGNYVERI